MFAPPRPAVANCTKKGSNFIESLCNLPIEMVKNLSIIINVSERDKTPVKNSKISQKYVDKHCRV